MQHVTASGIADRHRDFQAILCRFVWYIHPKTTATSEYQQLLIYRDIFSKVIALFVVVGDNVPNFAHSSECVLLFSFIHSFRIIKANTA